jgi:nucleoside-diphosphate-sugar epimerase
MREGKPAAAILTGATGFLGGHLMAALLERGQRLVILGRGSADASLSNRIGKLLRWFGLDNRADQVETAEGDLLQPRCGLSQPRYQALRAKGASIIHCAADTRFSERNRREITAVNVDGLKGVLDLAADSRAPFFHHVSTAYVAGRHAGICLEQLATPPEFNNVYEETKACAEHEVAARCRHEGLAYTIIRPSTVYGDSRSGRSTRFNALYNPVRALSCVRDIYLDDLRHRGGHKARACGVALRDGGVVRLPLRVFVARRGRVDLIPVDYFVSAVMSILDHAESGAIYHLTSDRPKTIDDLAAYSQAFLRVDGIEVVEGTPNGVVLTPPEALFQRFVEPYLPYLADTRRFDRHHTVLATADLTPPPLTYEVFERCMSYATSVGWGSGRATPSG